MAHSTRLVSQTPLLQIAGLRYHCAVEGGKADDKLEPQLVNGQGHSSQLIEQLSTVILRDWRLYSFLIA
jgi:hypothetical protein